MVAGRVEEGVAELGDVVVALLVVDERRARGVRRRTWDRRREVEPLRRADRVDRLLEADARQLDEDLVVALGLDARLGDAERVDAEVEDRDGGLLRLGERGPFGGPLRQSALGLSSPWQISMVSSVPPWRSSPLWMYSWRPRNVGVEVSVWPSGWWTTR